MENNYQNFRPARISKQSWSYSSKASRTKNIQQQSIQQQEKTISKIYTSTKTSRTKLYTSTKTELPQQLGQNRARTHIAADGRGWRSHLSDQNNTDHSQKRMEHRDEVAASHCNTEMKMQPGAEHN